MQASTRFSLGISLLVGTLVVGGTGCGGDDNGGSAGSAGAAGAGGGVGGAGATGGTAGSGATGGSAGSAGAAGDGNDTKETATEITIGGTATQASLSAPGTDVDWYKFDGTSGQAIFVLTQAKTGSDPFDPAYVDLVVTLYDASGMQIAEQDDPVPRSSNDPALLTVLPEAGTYYLRVVECNVWEKGGAANCSDVAGISNMSYALALSEIKFDKPGELKETEPNEDPATATPLTFAPTTTPGQYYLSTVLGTFSSATDVDVYSLTIPTDLAVDAASRAVVSLNPQPSGPDGNGSTTSIGEVYLTTAADPTTVLARVDVALGATIGLPVTIGTDYLAFFKRAATPSGAHDFYFDLPGVGSGNPLETNDAGNNAAATAEALTASGASFFIEGDIIPAGTDADHYSVTVPALAADTVSVACGAQRSGSGLRGFTITLLKGDGSAITGASLIETADKDALLDSIPVPAGETTLIVKLEATSQATDTTSTFYRCGVHFAANTP